MQKEYNLGFKPTEKQTKIDKALAEIDKIWEKLPTTVKNHLKNIVKADISFNDICNYIRKKFGWALATSELKNKIIWIKLPVF